MQNPVLDDIFKELQSYNSVFKEILEQVEKAKNNGTQLALHEDIFNERRLDEAGMFNNVSLESSRKHCMQHPKKEETAGCKQDAKKFKQNAGGEPITEEHKEEKDDEDQLSKKPLNECGSAEILRKCCNLFGKEIPEKLSLSTQCLLSLGQTYMNYAADWDGLQIFVNNASELETILIEFLQGTASEYETKLKIFEEKGEKVLRRFFETDPLLPTTSEQYEQITNAGFMNQKMFAYFANLQEQRALKELLILFRVSKKLKRMMEVNSGDGIQQNMNFVKAAALLVGGIVRCEIIKEPVLIKLAKKDLRKLHREIMKIDHVRGDKNVDICAFTEEIKRTLEFYRKEIAGKLETIAQIQYCLSLNSVTQYDDRMRVSDVRELNTVTQYDDRMRVSDVREICEQCTKYYLGIMAKVAEKCESIMGKPPCKFSIIGLGSLARKEVTLYSDFEHAILLEDGIGDGSEAIEYFRWFSTIFQVIIIGLGETVIPSVGVKSLNDFYSSDETRNWFFDEYTPCGVSFDGMMPHACKSPVGRQEPTKRRSHTVELIQPVSKMVNYLTKDEEVKNGYFLSDILSKVCFVYGSRDVYEDYNRRKRGLLNSKTQKEIAEQQLHIIERNPNYAVRHFDALNIVSDGKIKTSSYRPLATLLSCAAAFHSLSAKSSFEIVDELRSREIIDNQSHFQLISAVGTAMEIRLKTYLQAGNQRENVATSDLQEMVGKERLIICYIFLNVLKKWLQEDMHKIHRGIPIPKIISEPAKDFVDGILLLFQEYEKVMLVNMRSIRETIQQFQNSEITALESRALLTAQFDSLFRCFICFLGRKGENTQEQDNLISSLSLQSWKWLHEIAMRCCEDEWYHKRANLHQFLGKLYRWQGKPENAQKEELEYFRLEIKMLKSTGLIESRNFLEPDFIKCMLEVMSPDECLQHLNELLNEAKDFSTICCINFGICEVLLAKRMKKQAEESLRTLVTDIRENARCLGQFLFHALLLKIHKLQNENGIDSLLVEILLRNNTHDVKQNNVNRASSSSVLDKMEYSYLQRKWADDKKMSYFYRARLSGLFRMVNMLREDFSAFSRKRIIQLFSRRNLIDMDDRTAYLMVLCEICHASDLNCLIDFLRTTPDIVKARLIIQPFLSALFADFFQRPTASFARCSMQFRTRDQLSHIASKQRAVIQALFRYSGKGGNLHNLAIGHFKEFRFEECAQLSWKQLHRRGNNQTLQETSIKLFLTTTLATVVLQKRQSPAKYFEKTHEISLRQMFDMLCTLCSSQRFTMRFYTSYYWFYRYNFEDKEKTLVQIFNLAVETYSLSSLNAAKLLWKIVNAPNVTALVMKDSLHLLIRCVQGRFKEQTNPDHVNVRVISPT